jgi:hypothetical protein
MLNQNTMFSVAELTDQYETESALHINFDGPEQKREAIITEGMSCEDIEKVFILSFILHYSFYVFIFTNFI